MRHRSNRPVAHAIAVLLGLAVLPSAHALSTDREKPMDVKSQYAKTTQGSDKSPGIAYLKGDVRIVQGSMKSNGAEATVYQHPSGAKDAQGNDIAGSVQRVVIVGKKAHIEQLQDGGGLVTADADNIDYNNDTSIAILTGGVTVVQQGRGTFNGEHMTYNTNTGEMESTDTKSNLPVHMIFEPKNKPADAAKPDAAKPTDGDAAKPATTPKPAKPGKKAKKSATAPAAAPATTPAATPATSGATP